MNPYCGTGALLEDVAPWTNKMISFSRNKVMPSPPHLLVEGTLTHLYGDRPSQGPEGRLNPIPDQRELYMVLRAVEEV